MLDRDIGTGWLATGVPAAHVSAALELLEEVLATPEDEIQRAAAVRAFEFTCELSWTLIHACLRAEGARVTDPEATLRAAAAAEIVSSAERWRDYRCACQLVARADNDAKSMYVNALITETFLDDVRALLAHPRIGVQALHR